MHFTKNRYLCIQIVIDPKRCICLGNSSQLSPSMTGGELFLLTSSVEQCLPQFRNCENMAKVSDVQISGNL